jgi:hypothetical protein
LKLTACPLLLRAACVLAASASVAHAQSIEPRAYSNAPVGVNFLVAGPYYTRGGLSFDSSLPLTDPNLKTSNAVVGYARTLDLWGRSGKFDVIVPYTWLSGTATYRGDAVERRVDGFADPLLRLSVNFYGAPALTLPEFNAYEQDLIVGASLQVSVPAGQYDSTKLVNIGTNRWSFTTNAASASSTGIRRCFGSGSVAAARTRRVTRTRRDSSWRASNRPTSRGKWGTQCRCSTRRTRAGSTRRTRAPKRQNSVPR